MIKSHATKPGSADFEETNTASVGDAGGTSADCGPVDGSPDAALQTEDGSLSHSDGEKQSSSEVAEEVSSGSDWDDERSGSGQSDAGSDAVSIFNDPLPAERVSEAVRKETDKEVAVSISSDPPPAERESETVRNETDKEDAVSIPSDPPPAERESETVRNETDKEDAVSISSVPPSAEKRSEVVRNKTEEEVDTSSSDSSHSEVRDVDADQKEGDVLGGTTKEVDHSPAGRAATLSDVDEDQHSSSAQSGSERKSSLVGKAEAQPAGPVVTAFSHSLSLDTTRITDCIAWHKTRLKITEWPINSHSFVTRYVLCFSSRNFVFSRWQHFLR